VQGGVRRSDSGKGSCAVAETQVDTGEVCRPRMGPRVRVGEGVFKRSA
jgi:hypothetical protein